MTNKELICAWMTQVYKHNIKVLEADERAHLRGSATWDLLGELRQLLAEVESNRLDTKHPGLKDWSMVPKQMYIKGVIFSRTTSFPARPTLTCGYILRLVSGTHKFHWYSNQHDGVVTNDTPTVIQKACESDDKWIELGVDPSQWRPFAEVMNEAYRHPEYVGFSDEVIQEEPGKV